MNFVKRIRSGEKGQVIILSLIILALGCLIIVPLLDFMSTNVKSTIGYQNKMKQLYACDAGIEDAAFKMIKNHPSIIALTDGQSWTYTLPSINRVPVTVKITKKSLLDGLLGSKEFKIGQPHQGWVTYEIPPSQVTRNYEENWVEYCCTLDFNFTNAGVRMIESIGVFFAPFPGDSNLIIGPYDVVFIPQMTSNFLESTEKKAVTGGFAFIWRWMQALGPVFTVGKTTGSIQFKYKVYDADWEYKSTFMWATLKEQDVSYVTNAQLNNWLVEASAGPITTKVQALEDEGNSTVVYISWDRN